MRIANPCRRRRLVVMFAFAIEIIVWVCSSFSRRQERSSERENATRSEIDVPDKLVWYIAHFVTPSPTQSLLWKRQKPNIKSAHHFTLYSAYVYKLQNFQPLYCVVNIMSHYNTPYVQVVGWEHGYVRGRSLRLWLPSIRCWQFRTHRIRGFEPAPGRYGRAKTILRQIGGTTCKMCIMHKTKHGIFAYVIEKGCGSAMMAQNLSHFFCEVCARVYVDGFGRLGNWFDGARYLCFTLKSP